MKKYCVESFSYLNSESFHTINTSTKQENETTKLFEKINKFINNKNGTVVNIESVRNTNNYIVGYLVYYYVE